MFLVMLVILVILANLLILVNIVILVILAKRVVLMIWFRLKCSKWADALDMMGWMEICELWSAKSTALWC